MVESPHVISRVLEKIFQESEQTGELILTGRKLSSLPIDIASFNFSFLHTAELSWNNLVDLPMHFSLWLSLETLNLSHNQFRCLPDFSNLRNLIDLDLSNNQLQFIPSSISHLTCLQVLNLNNNKIDYVPEFIGKLESLKSLDLGNNGISVLPAQTGDLASLKTLNLRRNCLIELPICLSRLALERLDVSNNKIAHIPCDFSKINTLQELIVDGNPLVSPPLQICLRGLVHIMKFLELQRNDPGKTRKSQSFRSLQLRRSSSFSIDGRLDVSKSLSLQQQNNTNLPKNASLDHRHQAAMKMMMKQLDSQPYLDNLLHNSQHSIGNSHHSPFQRHSRSRRSRDLRNINSRSSSISSRQVISSYNGNYANNNVNINKYISNTDARCQFFDGMYTNNYKGSTNSLTNSSTISNSSTANNVDDDDEEDDDDENDFFNNKSYNNISHQKSNSFHLAHNNNTSQNNRISDNNLNDTKNVNTHPLLLSNRNKSLHLISNGLSNSHNSNTSLEKDKNSLIDTTSTSTSVTTSFSNTTSINTINHNGSQARAITSTNPSLDPISLELQRQKADYEEKKRRVEQLKLRLGNARSVNEKNRIILEHSLMNNKNNENKDNSDKNIDDGKSIKSNGNKSDQADSAISSPSSLLSPLSPSENNSNNKSSIDNNNKNNANNENNNVLSSSQLSISSGSSVKTSQSKTSLDELKCPKYVIHPSIRNSSTSHPSIHSSTNHSSINNSSIHQSKSTQLKSRNSSTLPRSLNADPSSASNNGTQIKLKSKLPNLKNIPSTKKSDQLLESQNGLSEALKDQSNNIDLHSSKNGTIKNNDNVQITDLVLSEKEQLKVDKMKKTLESLTKSKIDNISTLQKLLCDGVLLCQLVNVVKPRSVLSIHVSSPSAPVLSALKIKRNVDNFIGACRKLPLQASEICSGESIVQGSNIVSIATTVNKLASLSPRLQK